jgi:hypothetical protein
MKKPYCCDASRQMYERYYTNQQNGFGDFPVFIGAYRQRGHGVGNILGGFFKRILPTLKTFAPLALRAGANVFDDVATGKSLKDSVFQRVPETISKMVFNKNSQSGSGMRRKRTYERKKPVKRAKRDIFS